MCRRYDYTVAKLTYYYSRGSLHWLDFITANKYRAYYNERKREISSRVQIITCVDMLEIAT